MPDYKLGTIAFYHGTTPLSEAIEHFDSGSFSHVYVNLIDDCIIESQYFKNTRIITNPYSSEKVTVLDLGLTDEQVEKLIHCSFNYLEDKYDLLQIAGLFLHYVLNWDTNSTWNNPKRLICSELVINLLRDIEYLSEDEFNLLRNATPNILYQYLFNKINKNKTA